MDLVMKLRELRRSQGLSQGEVSKRSGVGLKTISSFETGERIDSLKLSQLRRILAVYGVSEREFFSEPNDAGILNEGSHENCHESGDLLEGLQQLPLPVQRSLLSRFRLMVSTASDVCEFDLHQGIFEPEWKMLNSRN